jgi:integrase
VTTLPRRARVPLPRAEPLPARAKLLRPKGEGTVSHEPDGFHARLPAPMRTHLGVFATREEAERTIREAARPTVGAWIDRFLKDRAAMRLRNVPDDRSRLRFHVGADRLARLALAEVDHAQARAWMLRMLGKRACGRGNAPRADGRMLSAATVRNALTLLRSAFQLAVDEGRIERNPFRDVRVPRASAHGVRAEFEGVLDPEEQTVLLMTVDRVTAPGVMVRVALGMGLRKSELRALRWADVDVLSVEPSVTVRYGGRGVATKGGKPRRLPVFGFALDALVAWRLRAGEHASGLLFPGYRHGMRKLPLREFRAALRAAEIARRVCWHDLRHTCATSLLMGWWGRQWSVSEVQRMLGHASAATTERYLHARNELIFQAASAMRSRDVRETWQSGPTSRLLEPESAAAGKASDEGE